MPADQRRIGLSDIRITASTTPSTTPRIIAPTVATRVPVTKPRMTWVWFIASKVKAQSKAGLVMIW